MVTWVKNSRLRWYASAPSPVEGVTVHLYVTAPLAGGTTWLWEARALSQESEVRVSGKPSPSQKLVNLPRTLCPGYSDSESRRVRVVDEDPLHPV